MTSTPDPAQGAETPEAADPTGPATGAPAQAVEITEASEALSGGELLSRTAVIVVSYGSAALLERTLARVAEDSPEARIIVVDNYSTPAAREELVALASSRGWEAVLPETNTGFGGGMNLGVARARELGADLLVLLNPDAVIARAAPRFMPPPKPVFVSGRTASQPREEASATSSSRAAGVE